MIMNRWTGLTRGKAYEEVEEAIRVGRPSKDVEWDYDLAAIVDTVYEEVADGMYVPTATVAEFWKTVDSFENDRYGE